MPPKLLSKNDKAGGVLPVTAAARAASNKPSNSRLKLEIRRLPPGLTLVEFEEALGEEWKLGKGRIDWREYRQGKIKSPGKLPEQSRCYIHVINEAQVKEFEQRFLAIVFHDKAGTHKHPELRFLPPTLGYAPNQRVPQLGKQRVDNRQGTIDQDPDFIAFLEAETRPITKSAAIDIATLERDDIKVEVKSTPLIDDLREKKANKAKAAASKAEKKGHKKAESKDTTPVTKESGKGKDKVDGKKLEQAAKDSAKTSNKQAATKQVGAPVATSQSPASSQQIPASPARKKRERVQASPKPSTVSPATVVNTTSPAPQRAATAQRTKRDAEGIKKMLQKDLGIKPKDGTPPTGPTRSRTGTQAASTTPVQPVVRAAKSTAPSPAAAVVATPTTTTSSTAATPVTPAQTQPASFKAFLKHANPSQGMTESLIAEALTPIGDVAGISIDPRKGTAIAIFKTAEGLQAALQTKKVSVAQGAVEILEYRDRGSTGSSARYGSRVSSRGNKARPGAASTTTANVPTTAGSTTS